MLARLVLPALALLASGCVSMNRYGTARTLPEGEANTSLTLDVIAGAMPDANELEWTAFPAPHVRHNRGLAAGTELVLDLGIPGTLGLDIKRELVRGRWLDLAVSPGISGSWLASGADGGAFAEAHVPLLADLAVLPWLVLVPQVSVGWGIASNGDRTLNSPLVGGGLGLYFRLGDGFALQPVASTTVELDTLYTHHRFGLGFSFGTQPRFD